MCRLKHRLVLNGKSRQSWSCFLLDHDAVHILCLNVTRGSRFFLVGQCSLRPFLMCGYVFSGECHCYNRQPAPSGQMRRETSCSGLHECYQAMFSNITVLGQEPMCASAEKVAQNCGLPRRTSYCGTSHRGRCSVFRLRKSCHLNWGT